ncbi:MAG TPA: acyl-CoA dehydrogenase family protein [Acidimicrobiales bacterium]|nr:acyl-CoA dehydrogenase family protein [Acidimicrobiales bacterium]
MDFTFTDEQEAVAESARGVFEGVATSERVSAVEGTDDRFDPELWAELARANLLGVAVPETYGGSGLGMTEICLVLEQQGRTVAPIPLWATLVLGAMPIARFGSDELKNALLPGVVSGDVRLSAAITEVAASPSRTASIRAERDGDGWRLWGTSLAVPQAHLSKGVVVPAQTEDGQVVVVLDPRAAGAELERATTTDRQVHPHLHLEGARADAAATLGGPGRGPYIVEWIIERALVGLCAVQLGVTEEAIRRAAAYVDQRHQFGRPLSSFQGTMLRAADAYIDSEAIRVTTWQAAWRLDTDRPASDAAQVAAWWASEAGQRVVHTTQHLHGGIGADVSYPIHRYFFWGKQIELMMESPHAQLARLGRNIAERVLVSAGEEPGSSR